jgi:hypothetical protein
MGKKTKGKPTTRPKVSLDRPHTTHFDGCECREKERLELIEALHALAVRFSLEFSTDMLGPDPHCRCVQFEDHDDCRHFQALRVLQKAGVKI